ncbi:MAG TPA: hypothetical protein VLD18_06270 [Verrucomicrobiae bacterium]|nr:hypothetical protein [Verrucomicrobiae bacterium]
MRSRQPELPIIAMSGLLESGDVKRQQLLTDVRFLTKPFDARKLVLTVHQLLERQRTTQVELPGRVTPAFQTGDFRASCESAGKRGVASIQSGGLGN